MTEVNGGRLAAMQLKQAGIDTAFGVVAGPMIEVMSGMQAEGIRVVNCRHDVDDDVGRVRRRDRLLAQRARTRLLGARSVKKNNEYNLLFFYLKTTRDLR